jgi:uncharacterized protein (TIGR00375 family)
MRQIADFHIHSRYSRACSRDLTLANIDKTCRIKGVNIVGTGDFTFPNWFQSIKEELVEAASSAVSAEQPLYKLKSAPDSKIKFILTTELSLIYKDGGKARRIHVVVHAPNIAAVAELNKQLDKRFNIRSDGRPILGMSAPDLMKLCLSIHPDFLIYPAHIWTPWFAVFGSKSGFDSLEECFHEFTDKVYAYESGLSSDPEMNWQVSALDNLSLLSSSDAHSLPNIGRECNVFDLDEATYTEINHAIQTKDLAKIKYTLEFYPEEGMYHLDGHRACGEFFLPEETRRLKGLCPKCRKPLTVGVLSRVMDLADRQSGIKPANTYGYKKIVELDKIIAASLGVKNRSSKRVQNIYAEMIKSLGSELKILLDSQIEDVKNVSNEIIAEGVKRVREGNIRIDPGFDGQYGKIKIFTDDDNFKVKQGELFSTIKE